VLIKIFLNLVLDARIRYWVLVKFVFKLVQHTGYLYSIGIMEFKKIILHGPTGVSPEV